MTTTVIGLKDFRQNISQLAKDSKAKNTSFIVTVRNKPVFEVKPCFNENIDLDETQIAYYKTIEQSLDFWNSEDDDNIFA